LSSNGVDRAPSVLDLFAAPGGLSQGFKEAGYRIIAALDNDEWGCVTLSHNLGPDGTLVIQGDIEELTIRGRVDVVVGGPPCQSFSYIGRPKINHLIKYNGRKRFIDDRRNKLYKHFIRVVDALRPKFLVMENVPGMLSFQDGRIKGQVLEDFRGVGYETDVRILNALDYGVPQIRKRAIFIGNRIGVANPFPRGTHYDPLRAGNVDEDNMEERSRCLTLFDAISDLPPLTPGKGEDEIEYPRVSELTPYQRWAREGSTKLYNHVARKHSERDRKLFRLLEPGQTIVNLPKRLRPYRSDIFKDKIRKQRWDRPSTAILAHMQKDCLMYVHPDSDQARSFTPREAARLQSFRDRYRFIGLGKILQQFRQIGNAVPPLSAQAIALAIKPFLEPLKVPIIHYERATGRARFNDS
jgi:DNA (cytosine-5)-methyltransferase 1